MMPHTTKTRVKNLDGGSPKIFRPDPVEFARLQPKAAPVMRAAKTTGKVPMLENSKNAFFSSPCGPRTMSRSSRRCCRQIRKLHVRHESVCTMAANSGRAGVGRFEPQKKVARMNSKAVVATLSRRATQPEAKLLSERAP